MTLLIHLAVLAITIGCVVWGQCIVPIKELQEKTPVFFRNGEYMVVNEGNLEWARCESTFVTCAEDEFEMFPGLNELHIMCEIGKYFHVHGYRVHIDDLICKQRFRGTVEEGSTCMNEPGQNKWHNIGFKGDRGFRLYFRTCYNETSASAIYSEHILQGSLINYKKSFKRTMGFNHGLVPISNVNTYYTQQHSEEVFRTLLGSYIQGQIKAVSFLARGHLAPYADGMISYFERSTLFFDNAVPQWQVINLLNLMKIEVAVRGKAERLQRDLRIFTGVHEVLELPDGFGGNSMHPIYLKAPQLEVPKWMWKIIKDEVNDEAIAFVTFNNPFWKPEEFLCPDISHSTGWNEIEFSLYEHGYTYCCKVNRLRQSVTNIPPEADASRVMTKNEARNPLLFVFGYHEGLK